MVLDGLDLYKFVQLSVPFNYSQLLRLPKCLKLVFPFVSSMGNGNMYVWTLKHFCIFLLFCLPFLYATNRNVWFFMLSFFRSMSPRMKEAELEAARLDTTCKKTGLSYGSSTQDSVTTASQYTEELKHSLSRSSSVTSDEGVIIGRCFLVI